MSEELEPGLGELLRHLTDLVDSGAQEAYRQKGIPYRPRYTPVMRLLAEGAHPVGQIAERLSITQGAVSQTLKLMERDGLITRQPGSDARQSIVVLTRRGRTLLTALRPHWAATFRAVRALEHDIRSPLRAVLAKTISALEEVGFAKRITDSESTGGREEGR